MCLSYTSTVTPEIHHRFDDSKQWLFIYIQRKMHLAIKVNTLTKIQSWLEPRRWYQFWKPPVTYIIEITQGKLQDTSEYHNKHLWSDVLAELNLAISLTITDKAN